MKLAGPGASSAARVNGTPVPPEPAGVTVHAPERPDAACVRPGMLASPLRRRGIELGFVRLGFAGIDRLEEGARALEEWRAKGHAASMRYLQSPRERADPRQLFPEARSLVVAALPVTALAPVPLRLGADGPPITGAVARYARGEDYHLELKRRLRLLADACAELSGRVVRARACVDTAPLLERAAAARGGVGFVGKSTLLIVRGVGPQVLLGELLLDLELPADGPERNGCGRCTACLDACPTRAFVGPYELDARRCISYLTIEHRGPIPRELRAAIGVRVFGCDVCQDVCPYDRPRRRAETTEPAPSLEALVGLLEIGSAAHRKLVRGGALGRASRDKLASNAAVALGNLGDRRAVPSLARSLNGASGAVVRDHAAWALGRLGGRAAEAALRAALHDPDPAVRDEAKRSLAELATGGLPSEE